MPCFDLRILALLLGLVGPPSRPSDFPAQAEVAVEGLEVYDEPDARGFVCTRLRRGDRVTVRDQEGSGWLAIDPPAGSFCWIPQSALGRAGAGDQARVIRGPTAIRIGLDEARLPGPPGAELARNSGVVLLDRPPLRTKGARGEVVWRAIVPPPGSVRYLRADGVRWLEHPAGRTLPPPAAEVLASYSPPAAEGLPAEVAAELSRIDAAHRTILRDAVEHWRFQTIRQRYEELAARATDGASRQAIRARLELVDKHESLAESVRTVQTLLDRTRRQDRRVALYRRRLAETDRPQSRPYDAIGMIQPSSRKINGHKVFALIGPEGDALAYLDVPPGLDTRPLVTHRVGVRGAMHFDESLRARLITVNDVEPLDEP